MKNISFTKASMNDFEWYYTLRKKVMREHVLNAGGQWIEGTERANHYKGYNPEVLRIICLGDERVGCVSVARTAEDVHISSFCIEPCYQKQGLGTQVLRHILNEPENLGLPCTLDVLIGNPSYRLYERLGFTKVTGPIDVLIYYARPVQAQIPIFANPSPNS